MGKRIDDFRMWFGYQNYSWVPAPIWAITVSPLLRWTFGGGKWFMWPHGVTKNPFKKRFWYHG